MEVLFWMSYISTWPENDTFVAHRLKSKETAGDSSEVQLIFSVLSQKIPLLMFYDICIYFLIGFLLLLKTLIKPCISNI